MSNAIQHNIQELADDLKRFNRNDILVHFSPEDPLDLADGLEEIILPAEGSLLKTYTKAKTIFRESGTSVLCISKGILKWEWNGAACESPILLCPSTIQHDKIKKTFRLQWQPEEAFLNPFLVFHFQKNFDFVWSAMDFSAPDWQVIEHELLARGFSLKIESQNHFGNFHHHRFSILRELENLVAESDYSTTLLEIFNEKQAESQNQIQLTEQMLFPADNDQLAVFSKIATENTVVHGPPGTGKSQVLANFLGKCLFSEKETGSNAQGTLVVSEKRVALEVVRQKMENWGLHRFLFLQNGSNNAQNLLHQLKQTWQFLESWNQKPAILLPVAKLKKDQLQFKLNLLSKSDLIGGLSYLAFQEERKGRNLAEIPYQSIAPSLQEFLEKKPQLVEIFAQKWNGLCRILPHKLLQDDRIFQLDEKMEKLAEQWRSLQNDFSIANPRELHLAMKRASFAQLLINEIHQDYFPVYRPNSTENKKFKRWSKSFFTVQKELEMAQANNQHWTKQPSYLETQSLLKGLKETRFFQKRKVNKRLKTLLISPIIPAQKALEDHLNFLEKERDFREIEKKLTEIGVKTVSEIEWVKNLSAQLQQADWSFWNENDLQTNEKWAHRNADIYNFYQNIRTYFQLTDEDAFSDVFSLFHKSFADWLAHRQFLLNLSTSAYSLLGKSETIEEMENSILKNNWIQFVEQFPAFDSFEMSQLTEELDVILEVENKESTHFAEQIIAQQKAKFEALHHLLQIPAHKLSDEEKVRKSILKKGRSLLIKEFSKTRNHPTIRELLESDSQEWIFALLPIWMVHPAQVGDFFPMQKDLFAFALFDEATQIPLSHALGSLQRCQRAMVLGDEHQMSPSHFFKSGDAEPIDLLHQARFNWPKVMLKHHYRSQDPALIAFSNRHFYNNELIAYPHANKDENPVQVHFVENAVYEEQVNIREAQALAKSLEQYLKSEETLGIVAFSEKQLKRIWKELSTRDAQLLEDRIERNTAFFRSLENVQGDECDHLFISMGYGPDSSDKLNLNFGPINRKSGRRRLNVLLSRARKRIDFFTSIQASDLTLSDNDSLNLLRQFLQQAEGVSHPETFVFPLGLEIKRQSRQGEYREVVFANLFEKVHDANELLTFYRVLKERNWQINFE